MEYKPIREAEDKWGVTIRKVQQLYDMGQISKTVRDKRLWAFSDDVQMPADEKNKEPMGAEVRTLELLSETECTLSRFAAFFPYPMQIMTPDGTLAIVNDAWQSMYKICGAALAKMIGHYNILTHPLIEKWGMKDDVLRLFRGEPVQWKDARVPLQEISDILGDGEMVNQIVYQDIISFPVFNDVNKMICVVIIYIPSRLYCGRDEVIKSREYIENHWQEKFDLEAASKASGVSRGHIQKLFKLHMGISPHAYYLDIKINRLQKKLMDSNLSISQAFEECGMDYNSYYVGIFKKRVGMTPMECRKNG